MANYIEVETEHVGLMALRCPECQNIIKKRKDSYLAGSHQVICVLCGHTDSAVDLLGGGHVEQKPEDFKQPDDFKGKAA